MSNYKLHLIKSGSGFASMTACGRNLVKTTLGVSWIQFKTKMPEQQCEKCANSKQAELNKRSDDKNKLINAVNEKFLNVSHVEVLDAKDLGEIKTGQLLKVTKESSDSIFVMSFSKIEFEICKKTHCVLNTGLINPPVMNL